MNKFSFGNYDSSITDGPFQNGSYPSNTSGETGAKKQLSFPLKEIKTFLNKIIPSKSVSGVYKAIQLRVTDDNLIQYSFDDSDDESTKTWYDTATGGHQIFDEDETQLAQKTKLMFKNTNVYNSGNYTVVEGIQGAQGVSVSSMVQVEESSVSGGSNKWRATLSNGTIYDFIVKNGLKGETGDKGDQGNGLVILGTYASLEDLQTAHPVGNEGDIYSVGTSSEANPNYVWDTDDEAWESIGKTRGEKGAKGDTGDTGATGNGIQSIVVTESSASGGTNVVTITMTSGQVYTFNIKNGQQGAAGTGVPTGGTATQVLRKRTSVDYDFEWADATTITVDQTYNPTSANPQSGVAMAGAVVDDLTSEDTNKPLSANQGKVLNNSKQATLVSGTNIKTINGKSVLGSGDINDNLVFGISRNLSSTSPSWTRTDDAVGMLVKASIGQTTLGFSQFDKYYPYSGIERVTLSTGDVMVKIPKFYYRRYQESGVEYIKICGEQNTGFSLHPAFDREDGERDYIYVGAYETSANNRSLSGASPQVSQTRATMRTNAKAKGSNWGLIDIATLDAIKMLIMVEFATNDVQSAIGSGNSNTSAAISTGGANNVYGLTGRASGTDTSVAVVWRGIENFWGNVWEWTDGLNWNGGTYYVCTNPSDYADDTATNYTALSYTGSTGWSTSYISTLGLDTSNSWCMMPSAASGSSSTYYCDAIWSNTGWRVFTRGGSWGTGAADGLFASFVYVASSDADTSKGSRLLYLPL